VKKLSRSKISSVVGKTLKSVSPTNYLSRLLTKTAKNPKNINRPKNKGDMSEEQLLFIQNEFTPSNMAVSLTDEKIYKK
jgi:hypothetical protein